MPLTTFTAQTVIRSADVNANFALCLLKENVNTDGGILFGNGTTATQDSTNLFWDSTNKRLGIGLASPSVTLDMYSATSATSQLWGDSIATQYIARSSSDAISADLFFRKTRGTKATVSSAGAVATSDVIGRLLFQVYGGSNYRTIAYIQSVVDTYTSDTNISSRIAFYTTPTGSITASERMRIDPSGQVGIGVTPSAKLHVSGGNIRQEASGDNYGLEGFASTTHIFSLQRTSNDTRLAAYGKILLSTNATTGPATGTTAVTIDSSQNVGIGVTPTVRHHVLQSTDAVASYIQSTHATFTNNSFEINATRSANSAYNFARFLSGNYTDAEFRFSGDGNGTCDGSWTGGGADYAEYFEWADGNPYNEDRRGHTVSLINNKIKIAEYGETVIGVVSARPSVVGDGDIGRWKKKYLVDDFGSYILDQDGHRIINPEYNHKLEYIPRNERPEWSAIGLMGKLRIKKGQVTNPSWVKMRDISQNIEEWLIK